jgi:lysozyme family protein
MTDLIKKIQKYLKVTADGIIGNKTLKAIADAVGVSESTYKAITIKNIQKCLGVTADGIIGKNTLNAIIKQLNIPAENTIVDPLIQKYIDKPITYTKITYKSQPVTQKQLRAGNTIYGKAGNESVLVSVPVPANYPLKYDGKQVKAIRIHKLAADRLEAALKDIINHYGDDIEKVAPGACIYNGSYNFRKSRGGSSTSIHSWGLAIDFDAGHNGMYTKWANARFSQPIYKPFLDILEHHGFLSLGRRQGTDAMHVQMTLW